MKRALLLLCLLALPAFAQDTVSTGPCRMDGADCSTGGAATCTGCKANDVSKWDGSGFVKSLLSDDGTNVSAPNLILSEPFAAYSGGSSAGLSMFPEAAALYSPDIRLASSPNANDPTNVVGRMFALQGGGLAFSVREAAVGATTRRALIDMLGTLHIADIALVSGWDGATFLPLDHVNIGYTPVSYDFRFKGSGNDVWAAFSTADLNADHAYYLPDADGTLATTDYADGAAATKSGTGACGANNFVSGTNANAAPTCAQPSAANLSNGVTGTGAVVLGTGPTITTPTISAVASAAGEVFRATTTPAVATTGASQAGKGLTITADPAVASTDTAGAAAGGSVTITSGAAARNTSGNANGGSVTAIFGAGIGTGVSGGLQIGGTTNAFPAIRATGANGVLLFDTADLAGRAIAVAAAYRINTQFGSTTPLAMLLDGGAGAPALQLSGASGRGIAWATSTSDASQAKDLFINRRAAATILFGDQDSATPVAQTFSFQGSRGGTDTNVAGKDFTLQGSLGTGTAASGTIVFKAGTPQATGTTQHVANVVMTLKDIGAAGTAKPIVNITSLPIYANNAAAVAGGLVAGDLYRTNADPDPVCVVH